MLEKLRLDVSVTTDNKLTVKINGDAYVSNRSVNDASGYVSFCSEGKNSVVLSDAEVISYKYDAPETIDYVETFENGYNANVFASQSKASPMNPSSLSVEDGKLVFKNTAGAYFSTRYQYSNFELTFDISDLYNEAEFNENGEPTKLISNRFGIAFGVDSVDLSADATVPLTSRLQFEGVPIYSTPPYGEDNTKPWENPRYVTWENGNARDVQPMYGANGKSFSLWNKHDVNGNTVNVKFTMTDGLIELYYGAAGDNVKKVISLFHEHYEKLEKEGKTVICGSFGSNEKAEANPTELLYEVMKTVDAGKRKISETMLPEKAKTELIRRLEEVRLTPLMLLYDNYYFYYPSVTREEYEAVKKDFFDCAERAGLDKVAERWTVDMYRAEPGTSERKDGE